MKIYFKKVIVMPLVILLTHASVLLATEPFSQKVIEKTKHAIVTIYGEASLKAYENVSNSWTGTGFIINKRKGYILTNAHLVGGALIGTYYLFFYNGNRADAKVLYYDPWLDYAFLKVDPATIPTDASEIRIATKDPQIDQPVFIIGNNEGKSFSIHTGIITGLYEIAGAMSQHSIRLSLNTKGGSSGSPVVNQRGEAVSLNYGGSDSYGLGLHPGYLRYAIDFVEKDKLPIRQHIGILTDTYSLNDAVKYRKFPVDKLTWYNQKFPAAKGNVIQVTRVLPGSPAEGKLRAGDIIWQVNKNPIALRLIEMDLTMCNTKYMQVCLDVYRDGECHETRIPLYNLEDHKIKRMVSFGGTLFFKVDDAFSEKSGIPAGTLTFCLVQGSNTFNKVYPYFSTPQGRRFVLRLTAFDQTPIVTMEQLIQAIPTFIQKKNFTISYFNHLPYQSAFGNGSYNFGIDYCVADVSYDENTPEPRLFTFDEKGLEWKSNPILKPSSLEERR
jgi:S1-C subfamily serine protease